MTLSRQTCYNPHFAQLQFISVTPRLAELRRQLADPDRLPKLSVDFKLVPLSRKTLEQAIKLVETAFPTLTPDHPEHPRLAFSASLLKAKSPVLTDLSLTTGVTSAKYWVAIDNSTSKVIGTTGLYTYKKDEHEAYWGGWMAVDPDCRGNGIGNALLELAIDRARKDGKQFLRLYTSTEPNEAVAHILYGRYGFKVVNDEPIEGTEFRMLYQELKLS